MNANEIELPLTQGFTCIIDADDFPEISKHHWCYDKGYAMRTIYVGGGKTKCLYLHVHILGKKSGLEIDHINGNRLDNRKINLRHVTRRQNIHNKVSNRNSSSKHKGVYWHSKDKKWVSQIKIDGRKFHLGTYATESDAAWVYNVWAESLFGKYARLNALEVT